MKKRLSDDEVDEFINLIRKDRLINKKYEVYLSVNDKEKIIDGNVYFRAISIFTGNIKNTTGILLTLPNEVFNSPGECLTDDKGNIYKDYTPCFLRFVGTDIPEWYNKCTEVIIKTSIPKEEMGEYYRLNDT